MSAAWILRASGQRPCGRTAKCGYEFPSCDVYRHPTFQRGHAHRMSSNDSTLQLSGL